MRNPGYDTDMNIDAGDDKPIVVSAYIPIHAIYTVTKKRSDTRPVTSDEVNVAVDCRFSDGA